MAFADKGEFEAVISIKFCANLTVSTYRVTIFRDIVVEHSGLNKKERIENCTFATTHV